MLEAAAAASKIRLYRMALQVTLSIMLICDGELQNDHGEDS